jgi:polygalacturonase
MKRIISFLVMVCLGTSFALGQAEAARSFDVYAFGAAGDGVTLDTKAIQSAVDKCAELGGVVVFSRGIFLTGSIELRSNVELRVQTGSTILGSPDIADYFERIPKLKSYNNVFLRHSLFYAEGQSNISITGSGTIDGQGAQFKVLTKEKPARYKNRPYLIRFVECSNVTVKDVTLKNSASWMQHYLACNDVIIRGIRVINHSNQNNDMMDVDGCRNVVIADCLGDTDDDGITLKSTSERITENVSISNCVLSSHCNAIKAGTESTGGFRNITISNMVVKPSSVVTTTFGKFGGISGISLEVVDGGIMEGVSISNVVIDGPEVPIFIRLGNRGRKHWEGAPQPGIGSMKGISLSHIVAYNVKSTGCSITGITGHNVEDVTLADIRLTFAGGVDKEPGIKPDELADQYPEATMWGTLPAYGFFVRHVQGLTMHDLSVGFQQEDIRAALVLSDVSDVRIDRSDMMISSKAGAVIVLEKVSGLTVAGSVAKGNAGSMVKLIGDENARISLIGNDLRGVQAACEPANAIGRIVYSSGNQVGPQ